jgi:hypothetical protein
MRTLSMAFLSCLLFFVSTLAWASPAPQGETKITITESMVLYGNAQKYTKVATVNSAEVFKNIAAYKQIQSEKLTQKDAKYWILLEQANQAFSKALEDVAKAKGYDLVTEVGGVTATGVEIPDLTEAVNQKAKA